MLGRKIARTAILCAIIIAAAGIIDYVVNVILAPGATAYTPLVTLAIATAVSIPFCFYLVNQGVDMRAARDALAESLRARDSAEAASAAKTEFLANVSHELRTPLNAIIGFSEMMLEGAQAEKREGDIADHGRVLRAASHLLRLIDDLLDYTEIEAGRMVAAVETFDATTLAHDAAAFVKPLADMRGNTLQVDVPRDLGGGRNDPVMISRCLLHLLSNAAKFTEKGRIRLRARRQTHAGVEWLVFQVADSGAGIAPEMQARIFAPLTQADASATRAQGGVGMGLALTRTMAGLLGGDVSVQSALGKGSVFTLRVPALHPDKRTGGGLLAA